MVQTIQTIQTKKTSVLPGGGFLMSAVPVNSIFSREKFEEETLELSEEFRRFYRDKVLAEVERIDAKESVFVDGKEVPLTIVLLRELGEMGVLSAETPEEYDGLGLDVRTGCLFSEYSGGCSGFAVTMGAHSGIGTLPIVYFGNEEQKAKWLPRLATAEIVSCYALTEPNSGSDALSGRTAAVLSEDGSHYLLSGEKNFISNGQWADIAIVFARVDGLYSSLIVDLRSEGVTRGLEEMKMGQLGSSTTTLSFDNVKVPLENLLGEPGDAAKIALNILNLGRLKLGAGCLGSMKYAIGKAVKYGLERKQFGQPIIKFDMQQARLAEMVARTYAVDSVCYRIAGEIDDEIAKSKDENKQQAKVGAIRKNALESSIAKIYGSEVLHYVAQNAVFMHGGYGYLTEYHVERVYRDNIVDMIYEGTNDVNRMVIFSDFVRNLFSAQIPFREKVQELEGRIREGRFAPSAGDGPECLKELTISVQAAKQSALYAINHCLIACGKNVSNEQQVMREISDTLISIYAMDSTLARVSDRVSLLGEGGSRAEQAIAHIIVHDLAKAVRHHTTDALLAAIKGPGERQTKLGVLGQLNALTHSNFSIAQERRVLAEAVIDAGEYCF